MGKDRAQPPKAKNVKWKKNKRPSALADGGPSQAARALCVAQ